MSDIVTVIKLPGQKIWPGVSEWGRQSAVEMIAMARAYSAHLREQADMIDTAPDAAFQIDIVRGMVVRHPVAEVQKAKPRP